MHKNGMISDQELKLWMLNQFSIPREARELEGKQPRKQIPESLLLLVCFRQQPCYLPLIRRANPLVQAQDGASSPLLPLTRIQPMFMRFNGTHVMLEKLHL